MNSEEKSQVTAAIEILMNLLTDYISTEQSTKPHPIPKGTLIDFATGKVLQNSLVEKAVKKLSLENVAATEDEGGVIELPPELKYGKGTLRKRKRSIKNGTSVFTRAACL